MSSVKLNLVVAACNNRGIGLNGELPWKLRKDMDFFKKITSETTCKEKQNAVIMGRKTWFSIPQKFRPLKGRINIVLSREMQDPPEGVHLVRSLSEAVSLATTGTVADKIESVLVIGGSSLYKEAMTGPLPCRIYLTKILADFECDTFLPELDNRLFEKIKNPKDIPNEIQTENGIDFVFEVYEKCDT